VRKVRGIVAIVLALSLAGICAYAVYGYLSRPRVKQAPAPVKAETPPPPPPVKTFSEHIEPGMRAVALSLDTAAGIPRELSAGDRVDVLAVTKAPDLPEGRIARQLLAGVRVMALEDVSQASGRKVHDRSVMLAVTPEQAAVLASADPAAKLRLVLRNPEDDDPVDPRATAFTPAMGIGTFQSQARNLNAMIAPGMRAITVEVVSTDGVSGVFRPDDRVDVVATCPWGNLKSGSEVGAEGTVTETHRNSKILLQDVRILATDRSLVWNTDLSQTAGLVTLEVTPADAEKITVLTDSKKGRATFRLISRNLDDHLRVATKGAELLDLISDKIPYKEIETIRGDRKQKQTLYK
jgi:Flp pilus assembly protein CpaB